MFYKQAFSSYAFVRALIMVFCFNTTFFLFMLQARDQLKTQAAASTQQPDQSTVSYGTVTTTIFTTLLKTIVVNFVVHFLLEKLPWVTRNIIAPSKSKVNMRTEMLPNQKEGDILEDNDNDEDDDEAHDPINTGQLFYDMDARLLVYLLLAFLACALVNLTVGKYLTFVNRSRTPIDSKTMQVQSEILFFLNYGLCVSVTFLYVIAEISKV